ncbi:Similar to Retrovirus-related Pol polyprotein from transposon TNT 1-94 [Camponotus floridanus]; acc. no. EFN68697 [Pyronema omphalodes CBS 100304]|uniref:Similar to Retrovirus-related Pol polyprotein from transposon TNT 1-94 [Camponotus floridanus] acc. no. EFN68697 n=1 Tax=Pyronema omphalodes (strain CBS 100304) TaxID=1076935 RepID=U4LGQ3_PYROM|nr:Similar to Retrovirus-related Pol polyprotein from transposon TNT 1-94 [Camponotus floridanus]; acc. no. EFN68697 [Pyronema omphalodes CBS 100304]
MAASAANDPMVPALTGPQNYPIWRQSLKSLLNSKGLWKLVDGKEPLNTSKPIALGASAWDTDFSASTDLAYAERNELAYDLLIINIDPSLQAHVAHCKDDGKAAWETFKRLFDPSNITPSRLQLRRDLYLPQKLGESIRAYLDRKEAVAKQLQESNTGIDDNEVCDAILIGVEERYKELVDMLSKRGGYALKEVKDSLLKAEKELPAVPTPAQSMEGNRKPLLGAGADINVSPSTPLRPAPSKRPHSPGPAGQNDVDKKRSRSSRKPRFVPVLPADAGNSTPVANNAADGAVVPAAGAANATPVVAGTSTSLVPTSSTATPSPPLPYQLPIVVPSPVFSVSHPVVKHSVLRTNGSVISTIFTCNFTTGAATSLVARTARLTLTERICSDSTLSGCMRPQILERSRNGVKKNEENPRREVFVDSVQGCLKAREVGRLVWIMWANIIRMVLLEENGKLMMGLWIGLLGRGWL